MYFASCRSGKGFAIRWRYGSLITAEGIEHQFYPARYAQFVEYLDHVVPNYVFAQMEVEGNLLVPHSVSDKAHDISFALAHRAIPPVGSIFIRGWRCMRHWSELKISAKRKRAQSSSNGLEKSLTTVYLSADAIMNRRSV
jgi:hypothetical protein